MKKLWIGNLLALVMLVSPVSAEFYRYTDPHGNVIFTDDLSKVPEAQRSKATMYEESTSRSSSPESIGRPSVEPSSTQAEDDLEALKKEGQRLLGIKEQLDKEYDELAAENSKLKAEQKESVTPDQIKAVNKKVVSFNARFQAFQEKNAAYQTDVEAYNKKIQMAESKTEPGEPGQNQ